MVHYVKRMFGQQPQCFPIPIGHPQMVHPFRYRASMVQAPVGSHAVPFRQLILRAYLEQLGPECRLDGRFPVRPHHYHGAGELHIGCHDPCAQQAQAPDAIQSVPQIPPERIEILRIHDRTKVQQLHIILLEGPDPVGEYLLPGVGDVIHLPLRRTVRLLYASE